MIGLHGEKTNKDDRGLRLSLAGKKAKYMFFRLNGYETKELEARNYVTFATGHLIHEWVQDLLRDYGDYEVLQVEGTVEDSFFEDCEGHFDILVKDKDGKKVLVEIKTTSQFQYVRLDPKNVKQGMWFGSRNFTFDPWNLLDKPFNYTWLYQGASYLYELQESGEEIDRLLYLVVNKNTGHIAVGSLPHNDFDRMYELVDERVSEWDLAKDSKKSSDIPNCWEVEDGKMPIQCQYCDYLESGDCWDYTIEFVKGKPVFTLK